MATNTSLTNPLTLTVNENFTVRAIFKQVDTSVENLITLETVPTLTAEQTVWRDCIDGTLKNGTPPSDYVQVAYTGGGGGTCWEPRAVIGFEPNLEEALNFSWRRGSDVYPEAKQVKMTNQSSAQFEVKITTNPDVTVTPNTFIIAPRSYQTFVIKPNSSLLNTLADGISTIDFKIETRELI